MQTIIGVCVLILPFGRRKIHLQIQFKATLVDSTTTNFIKALHV